MTLKELQHLQSKLNKETFTCKICGEQESWLTYNRHGCDKAFIEYMEDSSRQEQIEEQENESSTQSDNKK